MNCIALMLGLLVGAGCSGPPAPDAVPAAPQKPFTAISPVSIKPSGTIEERVKQAEQLAAQGEYTKAIKPLEEAILIDERDRKVRLLLVKYLLADAKKNHEADIKEDPLYVHKRIVQARMYLGGLQKYHPVSTEEEKQLALEVLYEYARTNANELQEGFAIEGLQDLVAAGFKDFDRIRADPYWRMMRANRDFKKAFPELAAEGGKPSNSGAGNAPKKPQ